MNTPSSLPSRPRPKGEMERYIVPFSMIDRLDFAGGYGFAEAMHNRCEQWKQQGVISSYWEGIRSDLGGYCLEVYWLKPPPEAAEQLEQFRQPHLCSSPAP